MSGESQPTFTNRESYQAQLDAILSVPLTPDNIQTYADVALQRLIGLVQATIEDHQTEASSVTYATRREMEDASLRRAGLQDIETILDRVSGVADGIHALDTVVARADRVGYVITPPKPDGVPDFSPGSGTFHEARKEFRLKTALFVLQQDFGVDVYDPRELSLAVGAIRAGMVRTESYYQVVVPRKELMLLVCDIVGNATYVLDMKILAAMGISSDQVAHMSKEELNAHLRTNNLLGQRIVSKPQQFVAQLRQALQEPGAPLLVWKDSALQAADARYLNPEGEARSLTVTAFARHVRLDPKTVLKLISKLIEPTDSGELWEPSSIRRRVGVITPAQQTAIVQLAEAEGLFIKDDGIVSMRTAVQQLGINEHRLGRLLNTLVQRGEVEEPSIQPISGPRTLRLTPQHLEALAAAAKDENIPEVPEGVVSLHRYAKTLGMQYSTAQSLLARLVQRGEVDEVLTYFFRNSDDERLGRPGIGVDVAQQAAILRLATEEGLFIADAPAGTLSPLGLRRAIGAGAEMILRTYQSLVAEGVVEIAPSLRFGSQVTVAFPLATQYCIAARIRDTTKYASVREKTTRFLEELEEKYLAVFE